MRRTLVAAILLANPILFVGAATAASARPASTAACTEPVADRNYGTDRVVYAIVVDLSGCDWWDGGQIVLEATLSRLDGQGETVAQRIAICGAMPARRPTKSDAAEPDPVFRTPESNDGAAPDRKRDRKRSGRCDVFADLDHPTLEAALYRGEITYPWADGNRTVRFAAQCGPPAGCIDHPADPSPALGAGADLTDRIIGEAGDGH